MIMHHVDQVLQFSLLLMGFVSVAKSICIITENLFQCALESCLVTISETLGDFKLPKSKFNWICL